MSILLLSWVSLNTLLYLEILIEMKNALSDVSKSTFWFSHLLKPKCQSKTPFN